MLETRLALRKLWGPTPDLHESASQLISPESCILKRQMSSGSSETSPSVVGAPDP